MAGTRSAARSPWQEAETYVLGRRVRYRVAGEGPPVVLVHGLSGSARWWRRNIPALSTRYRVYALDLPGFGSLRRPLSRYALADAPDWLETWLEAAGLERTHLVGHSMGGYISLRLALTRPHRVDRLVLVAPAGIPTGRSLLGHIPSLAVTGRYAAPRFFPLVVPDAIRAGPWTLWQAARQLLREDVRPELARVTAPTLLVWGDRDRLVPPEHGYLLRRQLPDARLVLLPGASHVPMDDRPQEFNEAVLRFLSGRPVGE